MMDFIVDNIKIIFEPLQEINYIIPRIIREL